MFGFGTGIKRQFFRGLVSSAIMGVIVLLLAGFGLDFKSTPAYYVAGFLMTALIYYLLDKRL